MDRSNRMQPAQVGASSPPSPRLPELERLEQELAVARQRLDAQLHHTPLAVIELDCESRIIRWAGEAERLFGWSAVELVGRVVFDLPWLHEDDCESLSEMIRCMCSGRLRYARDTIRHRGKDGRMVHCAWHSSAIADTKGRTTSIQSLLLDVTDRARSEEAIRQARTAAERRAAELEAVLQAVPAAVWIAHDPDCLSATGNRTADAWLRLVPGAEASLTAPEGERPTHFKILREGRELRGEELPVQRAARGAVVKDAELEIRLSDGSVRCILGNATPLLDERGQPRGAVAAFVDITERRRAERALRESRERLTLALEAAGAGRWEFDLESGRAACDTDCYGLWGVGPGLDRLEEWLEVLHPEDREWVHGAWLDAAGSGAELRLEFRVRHPQRGTRWLMVLGRTVRDDDGRPVRMIGLSLDITERKQAEEALREADRRKDEFLAILAHELRNPLAPIRNALEVIKLTESPDPVTRKARDMIERQVAHLVRLIEDLMDVGRITRGRLQLRREPLALAQVLDQVAESIRPQLELTGQTFALTLPPEPLYVNADRVRLTQVLLNLLDNACKYTGEGGAVHLTAERQADEVEIRVSDTGVGIPPEALGGLFQMFARVRAPSQQAQGGLGVGLALARGLVEMHGGRIEARSEGLGRGATLVVRLPVLPEAPPAALETDQGEPSPEARPLRILVADDNRDVVESLSLLLELTGYRVYRAYDGLRAVEAAERCRPDLVLLDIGMPNLDGYEACRRIRQQPWGRNLPIVALTGWGQEEHLARSKAVGFTNHLVKPVDHGDLLRLLADQQAARR